MDDSSALLGTRIAAGDPAAAQAIFDRYISRLLALVRPRISRQLARRIDAEDVAQSAFRSFFRRAGTGDFDIGRGAPLWRLLSAIALNKLRKQAERHGAAKRATQRESSAKDATDGDWLGQAIAGREPDPADAAALADELEFVLADLDGQARSVVELRLMDHTHEEIAAAIQRSDRTVRRILAQVQERWQEHNGN